MAEFLRITTPMINRNQNVNPQGRPQADPTVPFQMLDASKVQSLSQHKEMLSQNQTIILQNDQPSIMANMLQDPQAVVHFLRTIYLVQEVVNMLPLMNNPLSQEIEELFQNLMLHPKDIANEMMNQEETSTLFRGELFDNLRNLLSEMAKLDSAGKSDSLTFWQKLFGLGEEADESTLRSLLSNLFGKNGEALPNGLTNEWVNLKGSYEALAKYDISALLKAMNALQAREEILNSVGNNLAYLSKDLAPQKLLSEKLLSLSQWFKDPGEDFDFAEVKRIVLQTLEEIENSILNSPKIEKNVAMVEYNLSRYADSENALKQSLGNMVKYFLNEEEFAKFEDMVYAQLSKMQESDSSSKVLTTLAKLIQKEVDNAHVFNLSSEKIEKIIYSMLSSPTNYTPLLHYVVPVEYEKQRSFAEVWIDPDAEEEKSGKRGKKGDMMQVLVAFVNQLGRFEAELKVYNDTMSAFIYVPKGLLETFKDMSEPIMKSIVNTKYSFESVEILELERPRSLMEVFQNLPLRRSGVNVKV